MIAVKKEIPSYAIPIDGDIETAGIGFYSSFQKNILGVCYRPPESTSEFINIFHDQLYSIRKNFPNANVFFFLATLTSH